MEKLDYLKYGALFFALLVLIIPEKNSAWIGVLIISVAMLMFWTIKKFGWMHSHKVFAIGFAVIALLTEVRTKLHKWMVALAIISIVIWLIKKYIFKMEN